MNDSGLCCWLLFPILLSNVLVVIINSIVGWRRIYERKCSYRSLCPYHLRRDLPSIGCICRTQVSNYLSYLSYLIILVSYPNVLITLCFPTRTILLQILRKEYACPRFESAILEFIKQSTGVSSSHSNYLLNIIFLMIFV